MADIIRGNVKVNIHCYETVDLNDLVRVSNEFQFPISSFHHAHGEWSIVVPEADQNRGVSRPRPSPPDLGPSDPCGCHLRQ